MIIFLNDDRAYLSWIKRHGSGFVLDAQRKPGRNNRMLHRATCASIRAGKRSHWTTGQRLKACSLDLGELARWAEETGGVAAPACEACSPAVDDGCCLSAGKTPGPVHLTPLSDNVLDYMLEVTVVQMTNGNHELGLPLADAAACLRKTPAQLMPAVRRLVAGGLLAISKPAGRNGVISGRAILAPTTAALRTLPAFAESGEDELCAQLGLSLSSQA